MSHFKEVRLCPGCETERMMMYTHQGGHGYRVQCETCGKSWQEEEYNQLVEDWHIKQLAPPEVQTIEEGEEVIEEEKPIKKPKGKPRKYAFKK